MTADELASKWEYKQQEYPDNEKGRAAAAAVRICAKELRESGIGEGKQNNVGTHCPYCDNILP